jgi:hypothetical protein
VDAETFVEVNNILGTPKVSVDAETVPEPFNVTPVVEFAVD